MANHVSSEKRARQALKRRARNRQVLSTMKTSMKHVHLAIAAGKLDEIDRLFRHAQATIAKTRQKGVIHRNNCARRIGRLALAVNKAKVAATA